jgi:Xaa-Pro aminopeptidase
MALEIEEKTDRIVRLLNEQQLGGVLLNTQPNFAWLTAGGTNGVDLSRENGVASLFVRADGKRFVLASKIEMARMLDEELKGFEFEPVEFSWEEEKSDSAFTANLAQSLVTTKMPVAADIDLGASVRLMDGAMAKLRYQLTSAEIERFRALGKEAGRTLGAVARSVKLGMTESEVAQITNDAIAGIGARNVVMLVAVDDRIAKYRHPVPKDRAWQKVLMIVVCVRRSGLIASLTRIVCAGKCSDELARRTHAAAQVNANLFAATQPGALGSDLYEVAARSYAEQGFPGEEHLHHQGGAAGYRTRDWVAHPRSTEVVQERQAFAWNPSITGSKVEETSIVLDGKIEIITASPGWPTIPVIAGGNEYLLPGVLEV